MHVEDLQVKIETMLFDNPKFIETIGELTENNVYTFIDSLNASLKTAVAKAYNDSKIK